MTRTGSPLGRKMANDITLETAVKKTAEEDVRLGSTTLLSLEADNTITGSAKSWIKLFDSQSVDPGTDLPDLIIPVPAVSTNPAKGLMHMLTNLVFTKGLSYFASKEDGKEAAADPDQDLALRVITTT